MSKIPYSLLLLVLMNWVWNSCAPKGHSPEGDTGKLSYATNLRIEKVGGGTLIHIKQPYPGGSPLTYYLFQKEEENPNVEGPYVKIDLPIQSFVATSTSQIGFIDLLELEGKLKGFTTTDFISSPQIRTLVEEEKILELGRDAAINMERLLTLGPDLVIGYGVAGNLDQWREVSQLGFPVIFDASYLEDTPLGQAEWIKLIGVLMGKELEADSIFRRIEKDYTNLLDQVKKQEYKPKVIAGTMYNGTWFMPGGKSWVASYIKGAGGEYLWKHLKKAGTSPLSFEAVYEKGRSSDYWIGATAFHSYEQIMNEDTRYLKFKAVKDKNIFTPSKRTNGLGGNDYYESGVARPDLVLRDFITILNPGFFTGDSLRYFKRLN